MAHAPIRVVVAGSPRPHGLDLTVVCRITLSPDEPTEISFHQFDYDH
jgi:hypothetical protein